MWWLFNSLTLTTKLVWIIKDVLQFIQVLESLYVLVVDLPFLKSQVKMLNLLTHCNISPNVITENLAFHPENIPKLVILYITSHKVPVYLAIYWNCNEMLDIDHYLYCVSVILLYATSTMARRTSSTLGDGRLRISSNSWRIPVRVPLPHPLNQSGKTYLVMSLT